MKGPAPDYASLARKRRNDFESVREAESYFRSRPLFSSWTDEMVHLYALYGLKRKSNSVDSRYILKSDPVTGEGRFFERSKQLPSETLDLLSKISIPVVIVRGALTVGSWVDGHAQYLMKRCFSTQRLFTLEGVGHLGVMEQPLTIAALLYKVRLLFVFELYD
jgi:hypothetical protein